MNIGVGKSNPLPWMQKRENNPPKGSMTQETRTLLRELNGSGPQNMSTNFTERIFESNQNYIDSIREARVKNSKTLTELKKLRYNFKAISAQILRSKTSTAAKAAVGKARAEVIRLKRMRQSGQYDEEELQYAIAHAMAMERVAKKKARHLQEEEMIHVKEKCESSVENSSGNTVLYGSSFDDSAPFSGLKEYRSAEYLSEHPLIYLDSLTESGSYVIFAVIETNADNYRDYASDTGFDITGYISRLREASLFDVSIETENARQLLTLVTQSDDNGRLIVVARRLSDYASIPSVDVTVRRG